MAPRSPTGSSGDELALKFLFANQDGKQVVLRFPKSTAVAAVKLELMRHWPTGKEGDTGMQPSGCLSHE
ncbi:hypothetical protein PINS_up002702 [Pythium insidiosum]|nr:hypothetical protein PINS_up002702 [Pythium insidiosum]